MSIALGDSERDVDSADEGLTYPMLRREKNKKSKFLLSNKI